MGTTTTDNAAAAGTKLELAIAPGGGRAKITIGKVTATEKAPTTCTTVRFWLQPNEVIRPFDVVRMAHIGRKGETGASRSYAMVQDLQYLTDSAGHLANFVSSDFGSLEVEPQNERLGMTMAEADVLYNDQEVEMPIRDGALVEWADSEGIKDALGLRGFKEPIPAGYMQMSNGEEVPIEFESAYLIGPEGAHLNIAGISGLATKTSYAMFLMNSIQQRLADEVTLIIFNVKGRDLLAIDQRDEEFSDERAAEWKKCGLEPIPFKNVSYLYPYCKKADHNYTLSHVDPKVLDRQIREKRAFNYFYDYGVGRGKLDLLFSDIDDPASTMESIFHSIENIECGDWETFKKEVEQRAQKGGKSSEVPVVSWRKFLRLLKTRTENDLFVTKSNTDQGKRRQKRIRDAIANLKPGDVLVVDVEPLPDYLQYLVFGDVIQTIYGAKLGDEEGIEADNLKRVVIFADELNKYAPKGSENSGRTLTRNLLEITERGRSLGVVLFGAEQFRSGVHDRILGNCSTNAFGRTSPVEISKCPDYRYFPEAHKAALTRLPQGHLLLQHAVFKTSLIKVRFPFPCHYRMK